MISKNTSLVLATLCSAMALSACGSGDSDSSKQKYSDGNDNHNEFAFESFDSVYDSKAKAKGIQRITWTYSDGNEVLKQNDIVNKNTQSISNSEDMIILSDNFEGKQRKQDIDVEGNKIIFNIYSNTSNRKEYRIKEMKRVNLSGLDSSSYDSKTKTGMYTALNTFSRIPSTAKFPKGSVCYIPEETNSFAYFIFDKNDVNQTHPNMKSWLNDYTNRKKLAKTEFLKVGTTKQYDGSVVVYESDLDKLNIPHAAVDYKGKIYNAKFNRKGNKIENIDKSKNGGVNCTLINKVAADFIQNQIVQYY